MNLDRWVTKIPKESSTEEIIEAHNDLAEKFEFLATKLSLRNFDGQILDVEFKPGEEKRVNHLLGVKPQYRVILSQSGNGVISDIPQKSNKNIIVFKNEGSAAVSAKILLLKE